MKLSSAVTAEGSARVSLISTEAQAGGLQVGV